MENTINHYSSISNAMVPSSKATSTDSSPQEEESGWTAYFEDVSTHSISSDESDTSSMVSDAASFPAWKLSHNNRVRASCPTGVQTNVPEKLTFQKMIAKELCHQDSLEDTASSPVNSPCWKSVDAERVGSGPTMECVSNSPKVCDLRPIDMKLIRKTNDHFSSSLSKGETVDHYGGLMKRDERCEVSFNVKNDYAGLKKRGLCLLPSTMLVNHRLG